MNIGFVGAGNMGSALINGLSKSGQYNIFVYDKAVSKTQQLSGVEFCTSVKDVAEKTDLLILTVKPNIYDLIISELKEIDYNKIIVSVAAGITTKYIKETLSNSTVIRTMPNTPALVGEGMTLIAQSDNDSALNLVKDIFSCVGKTAVIQENLMEAGTALSGSSPAMIYQLIDVMANNALSYGIPKQQAIEIAAQTVFGSAKMVLETDLHPAQLVDNVCSPGGTTIAAMNTLAKKGFDKTIHCAMDACVEKTFKMKK